MQPLPFFSMPCHIWRETEMILVSFPLGELGFLFPWESLVDVWYSIAQVKPMSKYDSNTNWHLELHTKETVEKKTHINRKNLPMYIHCPPNISENARDLFVCCISKIKRFLKRLHKTTTCFYMKPSTSSGWMNDWKSCNAVASDLFKLGWF
jgi:hypothetical protein